MYEKSKNPKRKAALKLYEKEAKAGDVDAQWLLCHAQTWQQSPAKVKLPHYQFDWCKEAAFNGHALSQVTLGYYYSIGVGLDDDQHAALFWLQQGLVSVPIQQQHLILTNYQIFGYAPKPLKTYPSNVPAYTAKYLEKGYQAIGDIYTYGRGVKANPVKGREYYTKCIQYKGITYEGGCDFMLGNIADQEKDNYEKESKEYQERQAKAAYHYSMASRKRHLTAAVKAAEYLRAGAIEPVFFFKSLYNFDYIESDRAISKETRNHVAAVFFINKLLEGYDRVGFIADAYARIRYQQDYMHILNQKDIEELTKFESRGSVYSAFLLGGNALNKNRYQDAVNYLENAVFGGYKEAKEHLLGAYIAMWLNNESYSREWDVSHGEWDSKSSLLRKMMLLSKEMSNLGSKFADVYRPQLIEELELEPFYKKLREKKGLPNFSSK
jgi:TPR repeat protein